MSSLIKQDGGFVDVLTMSSREIASLTKKRHDNVMADIKKMLVDLGLHAPDFSGTYKTAQGNEYPCFHLPKRETLILVSGYNVELRARIIDRWQELEQGVEAKLPNNYIEALEAHLQSEREKLVIAHERDEAIRTKAQIGSRREATAMAKASAAVRKANKLEHELGRNQHHATVTAVERVTGEKFPRNAYVSLRRWCKKHNAKPVDVVDERYGTVKAWPAGAWLSEFDVNLAALFGVAASSGGGESSHGGVA